MERDNKFQSNTIQNVLLNFFLGTVIQGPTTIQYIRYFVWSFAIRYKKCQFTTQIYKEYGNNENFMT